MVIRLSCFLNFVAARSRTCVLVKSVHKCPEWRRSRLKTASAKSKNDASPPRAAKSFIGTQAPNTAFCLGHPRTKNQDVSQSRCTWFDAYRMVRRERISFHAEQNPAGICPHNGRPCSAGERV